MIKSLYKLMEVDTNERNNEDLDRKKKLPLL